VEEPLADPRQKATINEKMKSLQKKKIEYRTLFLRRERTNWMSMDYMVKYKANGTIEHFKVKTSGERLSLNPCDQLQKDICTLNKINIL